MKQEFKLFYSAKKKFYNYCDMYMKTLRGIYIMNMNFIKY